MTDRTTLAVAADPVVPRPAGMVELPLWPQQKRWWFLCTAYPGASSPVLLAANRLRGPLAIEAWRRAVAAVVDRHEGLRVRFISRDGSAVQVIDPPRGLNVDYVDLTAQPEAAQPEAAQPEAAQPEVAQPEADREERAPRAPQRALAAPARPGTRSAGRGLPGEARRR